MKFKKSISFVLTLCMVLSLFATFVIPASAEATNVALGKDYTISGCGKAYAQYTASLTDGAAQANLTYDGNWFTFYCNGTDASVINAPDHLGYVIIDLEGLYDITSVKANCYDAKGGSGILGPKAINVYLSEDGENWSEATAAEIPALETASNFIVEVTVSGKAQYVKFEMETQGTFGFVNEVEVYGTEAVAEAPVTSKVVTDWNPVSYKESVGGATGAFIYDDAEVYANSGNNWWIHVSFAPSAAVEGYYDVVAVRAPSEGAYLDIPEGGFVWMAWSSAGDTPESSGAYALAFMNNLKVGDVVSFKGVDFANKTTTADATAEVWIDPNAPVNIALNKDYTLSGEENATYNAKLTDGVAYAAMAYNNSWFAFTGANTVDKIGTVVIDLGALYNVNSIKVNMVNDFGAGVAVPEYAKLYVSEDGETWVEAGSLTFVTTDLTAYWTEINDLDLDAQYVKYEVKLGGTFAFLNEIEVYGALTATDDESYKDTYVHADGVNVGTIQQLGDAWADKLTLDFWYLVEEDDATVTVSVVADDKVVLENDTQLRVWVDADMSDKTRTTLFDVKVIDGVATVVRADNYDAAVKSVSYEVIGKDYKLVLVLDKAALTIDGEYGLNVQLGQSNSTTMHSIKYDNVTGEGATYAPWTTTEFYEVFGKAPEAPATSQVVTEWNAADWQVTATGANGAYVFTDAEIYATGNQTWWIHASFKPTTIAGVYEVAAIRYASGDAAFLEIPEGGFVWAAHDSAAAGTAGAFAYAFMKAAKVGERVIITGVDFAAQTTKADATLTYVTAAADMDLLVSHNYNYNWHCFEGQIITMAVGEAGLKKAGDAPNMTAEDADILYIVELVDGAYKVTGVVGGKALLDVEIPENGFLYYVTANCTGYDKICHGELVGMYLVLGEIDLATKFAIDTQKGNPAKVMKAVSSFKTGDADLDGKITATDYAIVRKLVLGTLTAEDVGELALKAADVNGNGKVDARDYYLVKRAFLGTYVIPGWEAEDAE